MSQAHAVLGQLLEMVDAVELGAALIECHEKTRSQQVRRFQPGSAARFFQNAPAERSILVRGLIICVNGGCGLEFAQPLCLSNAPLHEFIKQGDREGRLSVARSPNHSFFK